MAPAPVPHCPASLLFLQVEGDSEEEDREKGIRMPVLVTSWKNLKGAVPSKSSEISATEGQRLQTVCVCICMHTSNTLSNPNKHLTEQMAGGQWFPECDPAQLPHL